MEEFKILYNKENEEKVNIVAVSTKTSCKCPSCGVISTAKHSRYTRKIADGSLNGISKEILLIVRKFKCNNAGCSQKIFTERLDFVDSYGRRSRQIIEFITLLALTTSAEKVSKVMNELGINISNHTVLRIIKNLPIRQSINADETVNIGIDDFALKKGNRYGTIICNLDTKKIIDVLPSRKKEDLSKWLQQYPNIKLVSRDGSLSYAAAIAESIPKAMQVSDKFHLIKNLLDATSSYIKRSYPVNIPLKDDAIINEDAIKGDDVEVYKDISYKESSNESLRQQRIESKLSLINQIKSRHKEGVSIAQLTKDCSLSRNTVRKYLRNDGLIFNTTRIKRGSKLDQYKDIITDLLKQSKSHQEIADILKEKGYDGSKSFLSGYMSRNNIKKSTVNALELSNSDQIGPKPKPQTVNRNYMIKCICKNTDNLTKAEAVSLNKVTEIYPEIKELSILINDFKSLFRDHNSSNLEAWITKARSLKIYELDSYTNGIFKDIDAVKNSMISRYTNGLLEGIVNKVKVVKRISYGRCSFSLLRTKILYA